MREVYEMRVISAQSAQIAPSNGQITSINDLRITFMQTWHDILKADSAAQALKRAETEKSKTEEFREKMTPVITRLRRFIATVPESERQPCHITFFSEAIKPRWSGKHAAQRDVAEALRQLNFSRRREWTASEGGFRSLWHWPASTPNSNQSEITRSSHAATKGQ